MGKIILIDQFDFKDLPRPIVVTAGVFDLMHAGHVSFLKQCKEYGATLCVGIANDKYVTARKGIRRPIIQEDERLLLVSSLACVDYAFISYLPIESVDMIDRINPDILILSDENIEEKKEVLKPTQLQFPQLQIEFVPVRFYKNVSTGKIIDTILVKYKE